MVIPNIAAILAWGLLTAFVIPTGWTPNAKLAELVGPLITFLLPILIGYTGGYLVYGQRGAVVGAIATAGIVVGADIPMFLGAMVMGPLGGFLIKQFDIRVQHRIRTGFEMLVNNFSAGILGAGLAILAFWAIGPVVTHLSDALGNGVKFLVDHTLLPLASIIVEPAKVLFLNNAINHGVLAPLGVADVAKHGKAIQFMIESNPGPGLGLLTAYWFFGPRSIRPTAPGAAPARSPAAAAVPYSVQTAAGRSQCLVQCASLLTPGPRAAKLHAEPALSDIQDNCSSQTR